MQGTPAVVWFIEASLHMDNFLMLLPIRYVIPAKAGIQGRGAQSGTLASLTACFLDPGFRRDDDFKHAKELTICNRNLVELNS